MEHTFDSKEMHRILNTLRGTQEEKSPSPEPPVQPAAPESHIATLAKNNQFPHTVNFHDKSTKGK